MLIKDVTPKRKMMIVNSYRKVLRTINRLGLPNKLLYLICTGQLEAMCNARRRSSIN